MEWRREGSSTNAIQLLQFLSMAIYRVSSIQGHMYVLLPSSSTFPSTYSFFTVKLPVLRQSSLLSLILLLERSMAGDRSTTTDRAKRSRTSCQALCKFSDLSSWPHSQTSASFLSFLKTSLTTTLPPFLPLFFLLPPPSFFLPPSLPSSLSPSSSLPVRIVQQRVCWRRHSTTVATPLSRLLLPSQIT